MASVDVAAAEMLLQSTIIPLLYSAVGEGELAASEPYFDYDDDGVAQDFGIDLEPPDPTVEDLQGIDTAHLQYNVSPSQFAETAIRVPMAGRIADFEFKGREYLRRVYDTDSKKTLFMCGRQVEKSTTLGNKLLCYSALITNFRSLFVAPSAEQAKVFSVDRIKDVIEASPLLSAYTSTKLNQAVFFKKFINFSQIRLRYAYLTADRVRGIPADLVCVDEIQDILVDNIPVIEQCAFHSDYKLFIYSGTPKSMDNTLQHYWSEFSTQNEWVVPCRRHGTPKDPSSWHWNILGEDNIGPEGLICDKCGASISARDPEAQWAATNPCTASNRDKVTFDGYRVPQIMVPWVNWEEVLQAQEQYSRAQFFNEKLGMSFDFGTRPITRGQLKACCQDHIRMGDIEHFKNVTAGQQVFAGIDWGTGEAESFSVISFGAYLGGDAFTIFWTHRFTGQDLDPDRQLDLITQMLVQMNVQVAGCDYGGGFSNNKTLIKRLGPNRIYKYQYNPNQKQKVYWEPKLGRYMVHRSEVLTDIFEALKHKLIHLPQWDDFFDPYGADILNVFSEYNERTRMVEYKRSPGKPDDTLHSVTLCVLASMLRIPNPGIFANIRDTGLR
jgi:hypothetical protein